MRSILLVLVTPLVLFLLAHESLRLALFTPTPIMLVRGHSMQPALEEGDVVIVSNGTEVHTGDVIAYKVSQEEFK